jgi:stalled ribosome rescue protein Dom34
MFFTARFFQLPLGAVKEVEVDATFGTNTLNAHLVSVMAIEGGYGVPIAYMFLESASKEKTNSNAPEVTECYKKLFKKAKDLNLKPSIVHLDKFFAEIMASKVRTTARGDRTFVFEKTTPLNIRIQY